MKLRGGAEIPVADKLELVATLPEHKKCSHVEKKQIERKWKRSRLKEREKGIKLSFSVFGPG